MKNITISVSIDEDELLKGSANSLMQGIFKYLINISDMPGQSKYDLKQNINKFRKNDLLYNLLFNAIELQDDLDLNSQNVRLYGSVSDKTNDYLKDNEINFNDLLSLVSSEQLGSEDYYKKDKDYDYDDDNEYGDNDDGDCEDDNNNDEGENQTVDKNTKRAKEYDVGNGKSMTAREIVEIVGISISSVYDRVKRGKTGLQLLDPKLR